MTLKELQQKALTLRNRYTETKAEHEKVTKAVELAKDDDAKKALQTKANELLEVMKKSLAEAETVMSEVASEKKALDTLSQLEDLEKTDTKHKSLSFANPKNEDAEEKAHLDAFHRYCQEGRGAMSGRSRKSSSLPARTSSPRPWAGSSLPSACGRWSWARPPPWAFP